MDESTAVMLDVPVAVKKKRGRPKKVTASWVEGGQLVTEPVDFDAFATKKAKEKLPKPVESKTVDVNFTKYLALGGRHYEPKNCVIFSNDEIELTIYANGVIELFDIVGVSKIACSARTPEQIESLVIGFGVGK